MKRLILLLLCASLCQAASVTIAESAYTDASGRLATGTITISWPSFSNGVSNIAAGSTTVTVTAGVMSVTLVANETADPPFNYTASFRLQASSYSQQWKVPAEAGPLTIQRVTWSSNSPVTIPLTNLSRVGALAGDLPYYNGLSFGALRIGTHVTGEVLTINTGLAGKIEWLAPTGGSGTPGGSANSIQYKSSSAFGGILNTTGTRKFVTQISSGAPTLDVLQAGDVPALDYQPTLNFTPLNRASNLSDLASASTARTNLGLGTAAVAASSDFEVPLSFTAPIVRTVNTIAMAAATASVSGYLTTTDWNTFNGKQAALGFTPPPNTLTITATSPLTGGGSLAANRAIACATCVTSAAAMTADAVPVGAGLQGLIASNCTKATGQPLTCPDGFNSGGGTGPYFIDIAGDTSGSLRLKANANSVTQVVATFPAGTGIVMYTDTAVTAAQDPALTGDVTKSAGNAATAVVKINGTALSGLATGPLCNTTTTGVPYACAASDLPTHASRHKAGGNDEVATITPASGAIPKAGTDSRLAPEWLQFIGGGGQIPLSGLNYIRAYSGLVVNGTNDIYTAPALKRAYVQSFQAFNTTVGSIVASVSLKSGGSYYRLTSNQTITTLTNTALVPGIVLEPGESIAAVTDVTGLNVYLRIMEYDSSVPMYSPRLLSVSSGDNTLYTVPASKSAMILGNASSPNGVGAVVCSNASGGSRTVKYYVVSSGNVNGSAYQLSTATVTNNTAVLTQLFGSMATGDFIVYNTDAATATQAVWTVVVEK